MANEVKHQVVTQEGLKKLMDELEYNKTTRRTQIAEQIKVAISFGDLSENAEYDSAKNEQANLEQKIAELENTIRNAIVMDEADINTDVVGFGTTVKIVDVEEGDEEEYSIVGGPEGKPVHELCAPCGICRQMLYEFSPDLRVLCGSRDGSHTVHSLKELLPCAFSAKDL